METHVRLDQLNSVVYIRLAIDAYTCLRFHQISRAFLLQTVRGSGTICLWIKFDKISGYFVAGASNFLCGSWLPLPLPGLSRSSSVLVSDSLFPIPHISKTYESCLVGIIIITLFDDQVKTIADSGISNSKLVPMRTNIDKLDRFRCNA